MLTLLEGSEPLHSDMVLLAIGVTPDTHLAKDAGLRLGIRGSIAANEINAFCPVTKWLTSTASPTA